MVIEVKQPMRGIKPFIVQVQSKALFNKLYGEDFYETMKQLQADMVRDPLPKAKYKLWS